MALIARLAGLTPADIEEMMRWVADAARQIKDASRAGS